MTDKTLFETADNLFGTKLAVNSAGKIVLEIKGTGEVKAYDKKDLTEVTPYTVAVKFLNGNNIEYHFVTSPDKVKVGDVLLLKDSRKNTQEYYSNLCYVSRIDTKSKGGTAELKGFILNMSETL